MAAIIVASICFCLGLATVFIGQQDAGPTLPSILSLFPKGGLSSLFGGGSENQTTVVILGVDDFLLPNPTLRAVWLATFRPPDQELLLSGVPTHLPVEIDSVDTLASSFSWTPETGASPSFLENLEKALGISPEIMVGLDDHGFTTIVDYLGGLSFEGGTLSGEQVLALHAVFYEDPEGLVRLQASVLETLIPNVVRLGATPNLEPLLALLPQHAFVSIQPAQLVLFVSPLLPLDPNLVRIEVILAPLP